MTRVKVDIDGPLPRDIDDRLIWSLAVLKWRAVWWSFYRTRRGWHLEIEVKGTKHPWRVIALQSILGSDYRREIFNLRRTARWGTLPRTARDRWNVLFTRKIAVSLKGQTIQQRNTDNDD